MKQKLLILLMLAGLASLYFFPRAYALGRYVTADEPEWLESSSNFYTALREGDWEATYQWAHPGVTTMWAGTLGILSEFPDYYERTTLRENFNIDRHLPEFGYSALEVLAAGRLFILLGHTALFLAIFWAARRLFGLRAALLAAGVLMFDPFLFAHSRFLHAETFLPDTLFLSLLLYLLYLKDRKVSDAQLSGAVFGLALLSKTPAILLLPFIALVGLAWVRQTESEEQPLTLRAWAGALAWWGLTALAVMTLLWPALWISPLETFGRMARYTFESSAGEHTSTMFYNGDVIPDGRLGLAYPWFYPVTFLWRTTPVALIGLALALVALFTYRRRDENRWLHWLLLFFPLLFMLLLAPTTKKLDRYAIPIYPPLDMAASFGWLWASEWLGGRFRGLQTRGWVPLSILALVIVQALTVAGHAPYYLSHYNALLGGGAAAPAVMMIGWGEGLDEAARYLNQQPGAANLDVATWYPAAFNYHFDGRAVTIPIQLRGDNRPRWLLEQDYLVTYVNQWQRQASWPLLEYLDGFEPDYVVVIDGIEYVRIYRPRDMTPKP